MTEEKEEKLELGYPPPVNFRFFLEGLIGQAWASLGKIPHPATGESKIDLPWAKYFIDMLGLIQEKTRGNLEDDEKSQLEGMLSSLRLTFIDVQKEAAKDEQDAAADAPEIEEGAPELEQGS